jgi:magnesium chelatase family protein
MNEGVCNKSNETDQNIMDFSEIIGQEGAKRGIEIAAAGNHNLILIGPPGSGKSSLAKAMAGILPPMTIEETITTIL